MGSVFYVEDGKKELACGVRRLSLLGMCLVDSNEGKVIVQNGSESSIVSNMKTKHDIDLI